MQKQEMPIIRPDQNDIRISFLKEESEENNKIIQGVVEAYNNTIDIKGQTTKELCEAFSEGLKKDAKVDIDITKGFIALYSHYGYNKITDNLKGISKEINRNDKFRHCIKSMFCCCLRNYRSTVENKKDFKQFVDDCEELHQKVQRKLKIGTAFQEYIKNKQERGSISTDAI